MLDLEKEVGSLWMTRRSCMVSGFATIPKNTYFMLVSVVFNPYKDSNGVLIQRWDVSLLTVSEKQIDIKRVTRHEWMQYFVKVETNLESENQNC